jgi:hypothetical protein
MNGRFRADPVNRQTFLQILQQPQGITHAMRLMNETSVLGRYLWVFRRIVGQMQHDLFHAYTVDQHILMVLRNVRRFFMPEHTHEYPFCSQLAMRLGQALDFVLPPRCSMTWPKAAAATTLQSGHAPRCAPFAANTVWTKTTPNSSNFW